MSKILIINASKRFGSSQGNLNNYLTRIAQETLTELGHDVKITRYLPDARLVDGSTLDHEKIRR